MPIAPPLVALKVLLAEDNEVNQRIALAMLKRLGHRAVLVPNGQAAVEQTERERFDVVLMDVQMPEMSGLDAATAIRAARARHRRGACPSSRSPRTPWKATRNAASPPAWTTT